MRHRVPRVVVGFAGLLVTLVLGLGFANWGAIQERYYLWRLRTDPDSFGYLLTSWQDWDREIPEKRALESFLRSDRGRDALARLFLEPAIENAELRMDVPGERPAAGILGVYAGAAADAPTWYEVWSSAGRRQAFGFFWKAELRNGRRRWDTSGPLGGIVRLLGWVEGHDVRLAKYPWLVCRVERLEEGVRRYGARRVREIPEDAGEYVCVFWEDSSDAAGGR